MRSRIRLSLLAIAANSAATLAAAQTPPSAAMACLMCHGGEGQGANGIPAIMKVQSVSDFTTTMKLFAEDRKPATIMGRIARGYSAEDVAELAAWFGRP